MNATQEKKLAGLKHYQTRYELVAEKNGRRVLIGYTAYRSRRGLMNILRQRLNDGTFSRVFETNECEFCRGARSDVIVSGWRVNFTGRTQRDCILSEELPFIGDLPAIAS